MRIELCRFNEVTVDGRLIVRAKTKWNLPLPVLDLDDRVIGVVENIAVEGNRMMGDIDFDIDPEMFCLTVALRNIAAQIEPDATHVSGVIMHAKVSTDDSYPWKDRKHG